MEGGKISTVFAQLFKKKLFFVSEVSMRKKVKLPDTTAITSVGRLDPEFNQYLKNRLYNTYLFKPRPSQDSRATPWKNIYHQHAKLGFKYWCEPNYQPPKAG